jgi:hypothetical protein
MVLLRCSKEEQFIFFIFPWDNVLRAFATIQMSNHQTSSKNTSKQYVM